MLSPDQRFIWNGVAWCPRSADGRSFWDGVSWRPVPPGVRSMLVVAPAPEQRPARCIGTHGMSLILPEGCAQRGRSGWDVPWSSPPAGLTLEIVDAGVAAVLAQFHDHGAVRPLLVASGEAAQTVARVQGAAIMATAIRRPEPPGGTAVFQLIDAVRHADANVVRMGAILDSLQWVAPDRRMALPGDAARAPTAPTTAALSPSRPDGVEDVSVMLPPGSTWQGYRSFMFGPPSPPARLDLAIQSGTIASTIAGIAAGHGEIRRQLIGGREAVETTAVASDLRTLITIVSVPGPEERVVILLHKFAPEDEPANLALAGAIRESLRWVAPELRTEAPPGLLPS